jgi:hypothetical protein
LELRAAVELAEARADADASDKAVMMRNTFHSFVPAAPAA